MKSKRIYLEDENLQNCPTVLKKIKDKSDYIGIENKHPTMDCTPPVYVKKNTSDRKFSEKIFHSAVTKNKEEKFCVSLNSHYSFQGFKNFLNSAENSKANTNILNLSFNKTKFSNYTSSSTTSYYEEEENEVDFCKNDVSAFDMFLVKEVKPKIERKFPQFFPLLRSPESYKRFGLKINMDKSKEELSPSNLTHRFLPLKLKDDESYKLKLFKYLKKPEHPKLKTVTYKGLGLRKRSQLIGQDNFTLGDIFTNKRRKISSQKKVFETEHPFYDNRVTPQGEVKFFKFYFDKDVGFSTEWQRPLRTAEMDDDVETDDDQLSSAFRHVMKELADGVKSFVRNKKSVRNYSLINN